MSEKTNNWSAVIVALLGLVGVLVAALIGLMGSQKAATELSISATMTAEARVSVSAEVGASNANVNLPPMQAASEDATLPVSTVPGRSQIRTSVGDGAFADVVMTDGLAPYDESWLWANNHFDIQRIRLEEHPDGCDIATVTSDLIWIAGSAGMELVINDHVVGTYTSEPDRHGYLAPLTIGFGDSVCVRNYSSAGFHIVFGPDVLYQYDSYCYRGNC